MKRFWPYLAFVLVWIGFSYPFLFQGKIPAPLDFLVNFYIPWDTYNDFPVKNPGLSDVVSQIIPWKIFNADEMRAGRIPIWNSQLLAGSPQLGNWQSGVLYPTSFLFLIFSDKTAWSLHVLSQTLLAGMFMIFFLRSLKISATASLLSGIALAYGGFMTGWMEWGILGHAFLWLPLALWAIKRDKKLVLSISLALSWLAGHPQTTMYVTVTVAIYYLVVFASNFQNKFKLLVAAVLNCLVIPLMIAIPQVLPGIHTYLHSAREMIGGGVWAKSFLVKPQDLMPLIAPDFFGNPVTRNDWGSYSYVEKNGYLGLITLIMAMITVLSLKGDRKSKTERFAAVAILICLVLSVDNPISRLVIDSKLPIISSSSPSRLMGIISFWMAVLAARGIDELRDSFSGRDKKVLGSAAIIGITLMGMWVWALISKDPNAAVTKRNLIIPSAIYISFLFLISIKRFISDKKRWELLVAAYLWIVILADLFRFHHKFVPFSPAEYWYPEVPVVSELKKLPGRSFGIFDGNLNLAFGLSSIDGYEPLIAADYTRMTYPVETLRKQARITGPSLVKSSPKTMSLLNTLGVRWVVLPVIHGAEAWELHLWEYPGRFLPVWSDSKYEIWENTEASSNMIEPVGWIKDAQRKLFILGAALSGLTWGLILIWFKRNYVKK